MNIDYSFIDDITEEEMSGFNLKKISKAYDILSSIGIEDNIYEPVLHKKNYFPLGFGLSLVPEKS